MKRYKYVVRRSSWVWADEHYQQLEKWASTQPGYWRNYLIPRNLEMFVFYSTPDELDQVIEQITGYALGGNEGISIEVGRRGLPLEEQI